MLGTFERVMVETYWRESSPTAHDNMEYLGSGSQRDVYGYGDGRYVVKRERGNTGDNLSEWKNWLALGGSSFSVKIHKGYLVALPRMVYLQSVNVILAERTPRPCGHTHYNSRSHDHDLPCPRDLQGELDNLFYDMHTENCVWWKGRLYVIDLGTSWQSEYWEQRYRRIRTGSTGA